MENDEWTKELSEEEHEIYIKACCDLLLGYISADTWSKIKTDLQFKAKFKDTVTKDGNS